MYVFHHVLRESHGSEAKDPIARPTNLGWVCSGPTLLEELRRASQSHVTRTCHSSQVKEQETTDDILRTCWELQALGIGDKTNQEFTQEKGAVIQATESLQFKNGRYEIGIPWRKEETKLVNNYEMVLIRLKSQEKSLIRKGIEVARAYNKIIEYYARKGYARKASKTEK